MIFTQIPTPLYRNSLIINAVNNSTVIDNIALAYNRSMEQVYGEVPHCIHIGTQGEQCTQFNDPLLMYSSCARTHNYNSVEDTSSDKDSIIPQGVCFNCRSYGALGYCYDTCKDSGFILEEDPRRIYSHPYTFSRLTSYIYRLHE